MAAAAEHEFGPTRLEREKQCGTQSCLVAHRHLQVPIENDRETRARVGGRVVRKQRVRLQIWIRRRDERMLVWKVTGGAFAMIEDSVPRGKTSPLHAHPEFEETFYVLHGEMLFHLDGKEASCGAGSAVSVPRGAAHAFLVTSDTASFLTVFTPGDVAEAFLREGGDPATCRGRGSATTDSRVMRREKRPVAWWPSVPRHSRR